MDPITLTMALAQFAPSLIKYLTGSNKAADVAAKAVSVAQAVTGAPTGEQALSMIQAAPDLALKYRQAVLDNDVEFMKLAVQNASDINATMQAEAKSDHWPTYTWRPAIGMAFAFNLIAASILVLAVNGAVVFSAPGADKAMAQLPTVLGALAALNGVASPILGIASWFRGKMQADPNVPSDNRG
jgi:Holin of 3TMs, for gene-transfer release